jgi:hypothetical protein
VSGPVKEKPGATLAGATGQDDYGRRYSFLRSVQKPFFAIGWRIGQECAPIETSHELAKWNRANERSAQ